ncbi:helix-turn-helix domain-containing protein [Lysinibacillus sp. NPDC093216]|uniref:helix-turn-helix domain-containing protein n=1 Tax=Lysinibacillus sp. NPDC093216 TaxID=3390576 RepID=UPI003D02C176
MNSLKAVKTWKKIISLRERRGWTQRELAIRVNLNVSVMNRIESNERPVKDSELLNLANVLEVSTDYILGRTDTPALTAQEKDEEAVRKLRNIWEIIKNEKK